MNALMRGVGLLVVLVFFGTGMAFGVEVPERPDGQLLDAAGLFDRNPERREALAARLDAVVAEHGLPVYVVIESGLIGERIDQRTRRLYDAWVGREGDGLVVVWDSDTRELGFGLPPASYLETGLEEGPKTRLPDQRVRPILNTVKAEVAGISDRQACAERLVVVLASRLDRMLEQGAERRGAPVGGVVLGTVVLGGVLAVLGLWSGRFVRKPEPVVMRQCYFPDVLVGGRLGASCGGGRVAVVDYNREEPEEE